MSLICRRVEFTTNVTGAEHDTVSQAIGCRFDCSGVGIDRLRWRGWREQSGGLKPTAADSTTAVRRHPTEPLSAARGPLGLLLGSSIVSRRRLS